jgi:chromosome partitioning protein
MLNAAVRSRGLPHVIVVGNEKGGSGKTTIAMHIAVALMKSGQRLATIDLDSRQRTLTHYMENRHGFCSSEQSKDRSKWSYPVRHSAGRSLDACSE